MDFWDVHQQGLGVLFLAGCLFFPRITLFFFTAWGGILWWLGLIFAPRFTIAMIATMMYWNTNPVLCVLAWFFCLTGETGEKYRIVKKFDKKLYSI